MSISHQELIELIKTEGNPSYAGGMCYGVAVMGLQAIFANDLETFDARLARIAELIHHSNLSMEEFKNKLDLIQKKRVILLQQIRKELLVDLNKNIDMSDADFYALLKEYENKNNQWVEKYNKQRLHVDDILTSEEHELQEVRAFLQLVSFNALPRDFKYLFTKDEFPHFQSAEKTMQLSLPDQFLEFANVNEVDEQITYTPPEVLIKKTNTVEGLYRLEELTEYFQLVKPPEELKQPIAMLLRSGNHAITVAFNNKIKCWQVIDANQLPTLTFNTEKDLAQYVLNGFSTNGITTFVNEIYTHKDQAKSVHQWFSEVMLQDEWAKLHDVKNKTTLADSWGSTLLMSACIAGDRALVKQLCLDPDTDINRDVGTRTPLYTAVRYGYVDVVEELLSDKSENSRIDPNILTAQIVPLYIAAKDGNLAIVELLLQHPKVLEAINQPIIEQTTNYWLAPLNVAAKYGHWQVVEKLLESKETTPDYDPLYNITLPVFEAAQNGHWQVIEKLLTNSYVKLNLTRSISTGQTPLSIAVTKGHWLVVESLLKHLHAPYITEKDKVEALYLAAEHGHEKVVEALLNAETNPNLRYLSKTTPLSIAAEKGNDKVVEALLDNETIKVDPNFPSEEITPLYAAAKNGHVNVVELLLRSPLLIQDHVSEEKVSDLLAYAEKQGRKTELEKWFVNQNMIEKEGTVKLTALHAAIIYGHKEVVKLIVAARNIEPDIQALALAKAMNKREVIAELKTTKTAANLPFFASQERKVNAPANHPVFSNKKIR